MNICAVIFKAELIQSRMFPDEDFYGRSIAVFHDVRQCFFYNADKAIFDIAWNLIRDIIGDTYRAEGEVADQAVNSVFQIDRFIMKIVHTGTDAVHGSIKRVFQTVHQRCCFRIIVNCPDSRSKQDRTGKNMPYIIMDFPGNAVALFQCCIVDFIVLFFQKSVIFLCQKKSTFFTVVPAMKKIKFQFLIF